MSEQKVDHRRAWVEAEVERIGELVALAFPTVLAVVALFLPMFQYRADEGDDGAAEASTLLGVFADPGTEGPTGWISLAALVVALGLVVSAAMVGLWTRDRSGWPGVVMYVAAAATLVGALTLWMLTYQDDEVGRLGSDSVDPTFQLLLAMVVPVWFVLARGRSTR